VKEESPGAAPDQIRTQLGRILGSVYFSNAQRSSQFLQFVVSRSIEGRAEEIKESSVGIEVYGRDPSSFDPKTDSIVRAEASRLRGKLREYYDAQGKDDPIRIELPKGSYTPLFLPNSTRSVPAPARVGFRWQWVALAAPILLAALMAVLWGSLHAGRKSHSIAVMPPVDLGLDRKNAALGETFADEMTRALVDSTEWHVAGRAPAIDQTGRDQMLTWLQRNTSSDFVLTGSYRVGENSNVRLSLQLVDVEDGHLRWTQTFHKSVTFLAESHNEFTRSIVGEMSQATKGSPAHKAQNPSNEPAREYYVQARDLWSTYDKQNLASSLPLFRRVTQAEPGFAPAWAGLADANFRLDGFDSLTFSRVEEARAAALKALALDESNAEAHAVLGKVLFAKDWDLRGAAMHLERAEELDPMRIVPRTYRALVLTAMGDFNAAQAEMDAGRVRLPPSPEGLFQQGSIYFLSHKYEMLEATGRELIVLEPKGAGGHWLVGLSLEQRGQAPQAIAEYKAGLDQNPKDLRTLCALSHAYGRSGDSSLAFATAARFIDLKQTEIKRSTLSYCAALLYTSLGRKDSAFEWLERARIGRDSSMPFVNYDPRFDPLRSDPRFTAIVDSMKQRAVGH
jgi:TolB-like protein/Flp pilus assembly protein TadD